MRAEGAWIDNTVSPHPRQRVAVSAVLCWLSIVLAFALSHLMLEFVGIRYDTSGGSPLQKIAPATYVGVAAILVLAYERGPERLLNDILSRHMLTVLFAWTWLIQFACIILRGGVVTATFDTFVFPMMLLVLLVRQSPASLRWHGLTIHGFMAANALLALAEFVTQWRLTPMFAEGIELVDWRSSALLGHPLTNATATGCYAVILMLGGHRDLPRWLVPLALGLQIAAMVAFGGRVASALLALSAAVIGVRLFYAMLLGKRFSLNVAIAAMFVAPVLVIGLGLLVGEGFLDKFISRFIDDGGSAGSRLVMFDVLGSFSFEELLIGPDPGVLATRQRVYGTAFGIENFWLAMISFYGLVTCIPFFIGLFCFLADVRRATRPQSVAVIAFFLVACTSSLSLAGKSTMMGLFVAMVVVLLRPVGPAAQPAPIPEPLQPKAAPMRRSRTGWTDLGAFGQKRPVA